MVVRAEAGKLSYAATVQIQSWARYRAVFARRLCMLLQDAGDYSGLDISELRAELCRERTQVVRVQAAARGYLARSLLRLTALRTGFAARRFPR